MRKQKILFSESEEFYRSLGIIDYDELEYVFNGMKRYKYDMSKLKEFDTFVCAFYTVPHNVILTLKFRKMNRPTVLVADGIYDFANSNFNPMVTKYNLTQFEPIIQDFFLVPGKLESKLLKGIKSTINYLPSRMLSMQNKLPLPEKAKVLITTANNPYFDEREKKRLVSLINDIKDVLDTQGVPFAYRIFDPYLKDKLEVDEHLNDTSMCFENCLTNYSAVLTTPSSIAITAMYHDRAVGLLTYRSTPATLVAGWSFFDKELFEAQLSDFINLEEKRLKFQRRVVANYIEESTDINSALNNCSFDFDLHHNEREIELHIN
ncbi:hypothetical protein, partial [Salinivibrio sp. MA427]|uniref:hypothetical protein n=1 Tax=Salinivibrio sp. MA427 TaxID=1909455 RepID=UPI0018FF0C57